MMEKLRTLIATGLFVILPSAAFAEILFSDTFDAKPDWSVPYTADNQACNKETGCTNKPEGYYGFYISRSVISPTTGNGLHLDSTNKRGSSGKGLTFWDQTNGTMTWTSGMQLGVDFPARKEIYVRYWMKMQPGYKYFKESSSSMLRKLNHISHYTYNGLPFTFFNDGGHHPTTVNTIQFANNNKANLYNNFIIRPDTNYNGLQQQGTIPKTPLCVPTTTGAYNYFDLPDDAMARGDYSGTGTEYNSPGMLGDGKWHALEFYVKSNSVPGVADGAYKFWLDGVLQIDATGLLFRDTASTLPEDIWNFVHIGGNAYNPFLGLGVSGEQWYAVDDVVISTDYSGPPAKPTNLAASATSDHAVKLTWNGGTNSAAYPLNGYRIYYGTDAANLTESVTVGDVTQAEITSLTPETTYYFSVAGFNKGTHDANENESLHSVSASAATAAASVTDPADATAPAVSISAPVAGSVANGTVTLSASATDEVGVSKVEFYLNGSVMGVVGSAPYVLSWNSASVANGSYTITARAYDAAGNVGTSAQVVITVLNDTAAPVVAITTPAAGSEVAGSVTVAASASDNLAVSRVEFFVNGLLQDSSTTAPYGFAWNTSQVANGNYTLATKAYDAAGNVGYSAEVPVTVLNDLVKPVVAISTSSTAGSIAVAASASDNVAVQKVEFYLDGMLKATSTTAPYGYSFSTSALANGAHTVTALAYDAAGNVGESVATVNVFNDNFAPSITSFAMPAAKNSLTVEVTAFSAMDNVGVAGYLITENPASPSAADAGWSATAPTAFTFSDVGSRTAYAWAKDAAGHVSMASSANVIIDMQLPIISSMTLVNSTGSVTVNASATDNVAVAKMQLFVENELQKESEGNSISYLWVPSGKGAQQVTLRVFDTAGNMRSRSMRFSKY